MATGPRIRVMIADDSAFMRKVLHSIISADPQCEVVGEARDGRDAVTQSEQMHPDVITMDINMPHMDGLAATEVIMSTKPVPIVIVSSESRDGAAPTLRALELGAIDFVAKPSSGIDLDMNSVRDELMRKIKMAAKVRVVRTAGKFGTAQATMSAAAETASGAAAAPAAARPVVPVNPTSKIPVVVIAASTGGPATLMKFMPTFPRNFPGAVLLVQHMPGMFTSQFTAQLQEVCAIKVKDAEPGEIVQASTVYVCPGTHHLRLTQTGRVVLDDGPRVSGYKPCADLTMETAAMFAGPMCIGAILTGMGNDGSNGSLAIKAAGGHVIAQDESTAVIFGMPAEAIKTGAVDQVLPLETIFPAIEKRVLYVFGAAKVGAL
jgi:two-component system, chemotaxis family, protein-glutamate methylesterase/glutaminase